MSKWLILLCFLLMSNWGYSLSETGLSTAEKKEIRKAHTAKFALYMGRQEREFIKLMNLYRTNVPLFLKYVSIKYGEEYSMEKTLQVIENDNQHNELAYLRPSLGLHLSAATHAILSGITAYEGHRLLGFRLLLFLNLNTIFTTAGENCEYGNRKATDILISLLKSPPHKRNILTKEYLRVGVSRKLHLEYGFNTVSVFSGPKIIDLIFRKQ